MSGFKDMVAADNSRVFMNLDEFAERRDIHYDGKAYPGVACVLSDYKQQARNRKLETDHAQGFYRVTSVLYLPAESLDGKQPEKGARIGIGDVDDGFVRMFHIAASAYEMGMLCIDLEAIDE